MQFDRSIHIEKARVINAIVGVVCALWGAALLICGVGSVVAFLMGYGD
jgi:hypothetical protein